MEDINFWLILQAYQDSPTYPEMVDFICKLMVADPENRMTSLEALKHHWLGAQPYQENSSIRRLQMKLLTEEELEDAGKHLDTDEIGAVLAVAKPVSSKSPLLAPARLSERP